jgi:hypothetical protein
MKVYLDNGGDKRLIGRADVPDDCGPVYEVPAVREAFAVTEEFAVGAGQVILHATVYFRGWTSGMAR